MTPLQNDFVALLKWNLQDIASPFYSAKTDHNASQTRIYAYSSQHAV